MESMIKKAEERGRRRDMVEQKVGAKCEGVLQPLVPRASKLLKQAKKDAGGFRGEKEVVEVDINGDLPYSHQTRFANWIWCLGVAINQYMKQKKQKNMYSIMSVRPLVSLSVINM